MKVLNTLLIAGCLTTAMSAGADEASLRTTLEERMQGARVGKIRAVGPNSVA